MTKKQYAKIVEAIDNYTRVHSASAQKAKDALIKEGIYTKAGRLTEQYGGNSKPAK